MKGFHMIRDLLDLAYDVLQAAVMGGFLWAAWMWLPELVR